ncbi:MAG: hypothetical protein OQK32_07570 [Gammaproteobacteria bacterium]|nr:hypothetical protein [Gammaproteobacteria bacterium]MCW8924547.1 hypothetical protein [Gammaproteobacteria bacterium]
MQLFKPHTNYGGEWKKVDPWGREWVKEFGGWWFLFDDGTAPKLKFSTGIAESCGKSNGGVPKIKLPITIVVNDASGIPIENNTGVENVKIETFNNNQASATLGEWIFDHWVDADTGEKIYDSDNDGDVDSNDKTPNEMSEDGPVTWDDHICIPCTEIINGKVDISITVTDEDGNKRVRLERLHINKKIVGACCSE